MTANSKTTTSLARGLSAPRLARLRQIDTFLVSCGSAGATFNEICAALGVPKTNSSRRRLLRMDLVSLEILSLDSPSTCKIEIVHGGKEKEKRYVSVSPLFPRYLTESEQLKIDSSPQSAIFDRLAKAISNRTVIDLEYRKISEIESDSPVRRIRFCPLQLREIDSKWRLIGSCENDGFIAHFYLEQVVNITITPYLYDSTLLKRLDGLFDHVVGASVPRHLLLAKNDSTDNAKIEDITLWVTQSTAYYLRAFPLTDTQDELFPESAEKITAEFGLPDNGAVFVFSAYITQPLINKLISLSAIVLSPASLRQRIREKLESIMQLY